MSMNRKEFLKMAGFAAGGWKTNKPNMDINLENGGGTTKILG